jgi:glutamine synthetase
MNSQDSSPGGLGTLVEAQAFLDANPDIEAVQLVITDACGVARGKNIAREELPALYSNGRNVAGSILGLDITGEDVDGTGLVWDVGDADQCCRPVAGSLGRTPWLDRPTAQLLGTLYELDGRVARADPRHVLDAVVRGGGGGGL